MSKLKERASFAGEARGKNASGARQKKGRTIPKDNVPTVQCVKWTELASNL